MAKNASRLHWIGGDSRSSVWFALAKLYLPSEVERVEAIRRRRRERVRKAVSEINESGPPATVDHSPPSECPGNRNCDEARKGVEGTLGDDRHHGQDPPASNAPVGDGASEDEDKLEGNTPSHTESHAAEHRADVILQIS